MHASIAPTVKVTLDKERHLLFDFAALEQIEETLKCDIFDKGFIDVIKKARNVPTVLWAGFLHEDETLKLAQVKLMLRGKDPSPFIQAVMEAWGLSQPKKEQVDEESDPTKPETSAPTGTDSGQLQ